MWIDVVGCRILESPWYVDAVYVGSDICLVVHMNGNTFVVTLWLVAPPVSSST